MGKLLSCVVTGALSTFVGAADHDNYLSLKQSFLA